MELTRNHTIPALRSQTRRDFLWLVRLNRKDSLYKERRDAYRDSGLNVAFFHGGQWWPAIEEHLRCETHLLTTRLDDDDAIRPDFVERLQKAVDLAQSPEVLSFPQGRRLYLGKQHRGKAVAQLNNQFVSLIAPVENRMTVMDERHGQIDRLAPIRVVDNRPAWTWTRHALSITSRRRKA